MDHPGGFEWSPQHEMRQRDMWDVGGVFLHAYDTGEKLEGEMYSNVHVRAQPTQRILHDARGE